MNIFNKLVDFFIPSFQKSLKDMALNKMIAFSNYRLLVTSILISSTGYLFFYFIRSFVINNFLFPHFANVIVSFALMILLFRIKRGADYTQSALTFLSLLTIQIVFKSFLDGAKDTVSFQLFLVIICLSWWLLGRRASAIFTILSIMLMSFTFYINSYIVGVELYPQSPLVKYLINIVMILSFNVLFYFVDERRKLYEKETLKQKYYQGILEQMGNEIHEIITPLNTAQGFLKEIDISNETAEYKRDVEMSLGIIEKRILKVNELSYILRKKFENRPNK
ncbi:MAG: hypothetical protein H6622_09855 [Halobacteriovoraceae bacterium]|nr:hypothetical protein [Halobacteriovoraceae bacterium]